MIRIGAAPGKSTEVIENCRGPVTVQRPRVLLRGAVHVEIRQAATLRGQTERGRPFLWILVERASGGRSQSIPARGLGLGPSLFGGLTDLSSGRG